MNTQIVSAGTYVISQKRNEILEAYLGSCVGVTISDRSANLGGMIHILLPEPTGTDIAYQPETYATSGLPLFIQSIEEAGASRSNLEACIAGGALMGVVSQQDLSLDIGGRTTETVQDILREQGIAIAKVETGGFAGCKLNLHLSTWETWIEPVWSPAESHEAPLHGPSPEDVDQAIERVRPIPQIALKIIRMIRGNDYDMEDIASEIRQDQIISAGVIKLCNTAMMGLGNKVDSIDRALIVVGEKKLLQLVVSASVKSIFPESTHGYSLCKGGIFQHALGTAMVAHELAVFTGKSTPDIAYTAGLLHDIGKIPLDQYMTLFTPDFYRINQREGIGLCELEREKFGISHPEAGQLLSHKWALPENLTEAIRHHHEPEGAKSEPELAGLVYLADLLMSRFQVAHEIDFLDTEHLKPRLMRVGLLPEHFPVLIDRIPRAVFEISLTGI